MATPSSPDSDAPTSSNMAVYADESQAPSSLPRQVIRSLEPTIRRLDYLTDRTCFLEQTMNTFDKQLAILKLCSHRSQQQLDNTMAVRRAQDTTVLRDRLAAMEQNILNLQTQFHEMTTTLAEIRRQGLQDHQYTQEILRQLQSLQPSRSSPPDELVTDLP